MIAGISILIALSPILFTLVMFLFEGRYAFLMLPFAFIMFIGSTIAAILFYIVANWLANIFYSNPEQQAQVIKEWEERKANSKEGI